MLPALREHHAEFLLKELYKRWGNHKIMVRWLSRFFNYLDRCARARTACRLANRAPLSAVAQRTGWSLGSAMLPES